jgi:hypothetical protein
MAEAALAQLTPDPPEDRSVRTERPAESARPVAAAMGVDTATVLDRLRRQRAAERGQFREPIDAASRLIVGGENPHGDPASRNPHSSASGVTQMIDGTYVATVKRHHPELAGLSYDQIIAMKTDPSKTAFNDGLRDAHSGDNATDLAARGVPVTPITLAAAYRAGAGGAAAIWAANQRDPNTPVAAAAPDLGSRDRNGNLTNPDVAHLTVGQFLQNPYPRGGNSATAGLPPDVQDRLRQNAAEGQAILDKLLGNIGEDRADAKKRIADLKPFKAEPPPEKPVEDPWKAFGSAAGIFAMIASGFSKTPAVAAMNGLTGAINGARDRDWHAYEASYKQWQDGTNFAIRAQEEQHRGLEEIFRLMQTDVAAGTAMFNAHRAVFDDQVLTPLMVAEKYAEAWNVAAERQAKAQAMKETQAESGLRLTALAAAENYAQVQQAFPPGSPEIAAAKTRADEANALLRSYESAKKGTAPAQRGVTPQAQVMQKWWEDHPNGTAAEASDFYRNLMKGEADSVAGRKDRALAETERKNRAAEALRAKVMEGHSLAPEERESASAQAAVGEPLNQIIPGYGPSAVAARRDVRQAAVELVMKQTGKDAVDAGVELANRGIEYASGKKSEMQLTTMLGATDQAVKQLDFNLTEAKKDMAKLPSTDLSPILNAIARGEEKWTGAPAYGQLFFHIHAAALESARILSGGQASIAQLQEGAREEAQKMLNENMTPATFDAVAKSILEEGEFKVRSYEESIQRQRERRGGGAGAPSPARNSGGPPPPPPEAIEELRKKPDTAAQFDEIFGEGAARRVLGH